eukprot:scaffold36578_cov144-Skeletonema_dohrnii-CCMP3373.AAC.1
MAKTPQKQTPIKAAPATAVISVTMNDLNKVNNNLKTALDKIDHDRATQINKLEEKEKQLLDRLNKLEKEKLKTASAN